MYDLNNKFNTFYRKHVVLPKEKKNDLFQKKNLNISRLKKGLEEYNEEHGTDYQLIDHVVQGSVAMSTVVQNEDNDYDIDVAIIFDKDKLPEGTRATKNIIVDALKRKCTGFKKEPEAKTNCVRIEYSEGYHIDFAIYRRYKDDNENYVYEHGGSEWRRRDPWAITKWFLNRNKENDYKLREVVRLLKMFVKSRDHWVNMPGGLV
ncbi:cyclic GMP-AMP synthase DncV-like nucleotidyltransferase, partial [Geobacillus stearothermophilus]|nr:nucleotidyltransferase [Geobacillus stearothermophilus]